MRFFIARSFARFCCCLLLLLFAFVVVRGSHNSADAVIAPFLATKILKTMMQSLLLF